MLLQHKLSALLSWESTITEGEQGPGLLLTVVPQYLGPSLTQRKDSLNIC